MPHKGLIAVTGGTGFVGRHVIKVLLDSGYAVRALARTPSKLSDISHDNLSVLKGSLGRHDKAAQVAGLSRFILLSSQTAAQPHLSDYAASKRAGELAVSAAFKGTLAIIRAPACLWLEARIGERAKWRWSMLKISREILRREPLLEIMTVKL